MSTPELDELSKAVTNLRTNFDSLTKTALRVKRDRDELLEALRILVDHAQEQYPHFESERGQRDIGAALAAIANAEREDD